MFSLPRKDKLSSILDDTQSLPFIVGNRTHYISMTKMMTRQELVNAESLSIKEKA